ncbi:hypothetical protein [Streptomyces sp. NPDC059916]|uniref:hypothetical protein n=1 Tax=Streptomyces sp. NPDC059916 TaxID=3347001 RepID=UPI0036AA7287
MGGRTMAIAALHPSPTPRGFKDAVTVKEAVALFAETGYPVPDTTLRTWAKAAGLESVRRGQRVEYSYSDLLEVHARHMFDD